MTRTKNQILDALDPTRPETIQALIDFHRQSLGGYVMEDESGKDGKSQDGDKSQGENGKDGAKGNDGDGDTSKDQKSKDTKSDGESDDEKDLGEAGRKAIRSEREARKALEKELSDFKASQANQAKKLAEALGIETKDAKSSDDVLDTLKAEVTELRLNLLVDQIARDTKVTDEADIALIRGAGNEDAMRKLARRLAPKDGDAKKGGDDEDSDDGDKKRRRTPRQDSSQGKGGGGQEKSGLDAGKAEALRRFPSKTK